MWIRIILLYVYPLSDCFGKYVQKLSQYEFVDYATNDYVLVIYSSQLYCDISRTHLLEQVQTWVCTRNLLLLFRVWLYSL